MGKAKFAVALAAVAAVLALPAGAADTTPGSITVGGTGTATATPDLSHWSFGVQAAGATASATLRSVSTQTAAVIAALKSAGVAAADLQTQGVSLSTRMNQDGTKVVGYSASQGVSATLRNLGTAGAIVDAAVAAGATDVSGPDLSVSGQTALQRQALQAAFDDAKAKAQALAQRAGVTLGQVTQIQESSGAPIPFVGAKAAAPSDAAQVPIEPGQSETTATVTVTFAIS